MAITLDGTNGISTPDLEPTGSTVPTNGVYLPAANSVGIATNSSERVRVDSSGNVGIGGTPVKTLSVLPTSIRRMDFYVRNPGTDDALVIRSQHATNNNIRDMILEGSFLRFFTGADSGSSGSESMRIDSSGNLYVGQTGTIYQNSNSLFYGATAANTGYLILNHANGSNSGNLFLSCGYNGSAIGGIAQNGTTAVSYNTSSDYRLKENIAPMTGALAKVAALNPVTYNWKVDGSAGQGFIAHELQAVVPDCVTGEKDAVDAEGKPQYQGIDTSFLVATLTAAIKEQQAIIEQQSQAIASITTRIAALEQQP